MTPNEWLFTMRQKTIQVYKRYEKIILPLVKFILYFSIIHLINGALGAKGLMAALYGEVILALLGIILTDKLVAIMLGAIIIIHLFRLNIILGMIALILFIILYIGIIRLYPKESLLIFIMPIAFYLKLEYALPIIIALFGSVMCIFPISLGVFFWFSGKQLIAIMEGGGAAGESVVDVLTTLGTLFFKNVVTDATMLSTIGIFIIVYMIVFIIRKQSLDYSAYIGIGVGGVMNLLGFGMSSLFLNTEVNLFLMILMSIVSVVIAIIVEFFSKVLDYSRAESVQFEDEDNYYYVKVVPKIPMVTTNKKVKKVYSDENVEYINNNEKQPKDTV